MNEHRVCLINALLSLYFLPSLSFFWFPAHCIWDALSLQNVFWSLTITASSRMCSCAFVFLYITFGCFVFVSYVCRAAVVPELTGQKTTPNSQKAGRTRAAPAVPCSPRDP